MDIFGRNKSLPTLKDLKKVARSRGVGWRNIKGKKKEELSNLLNIPLIYNPKYEPPERPSNDNLWFIAKMSEGNCGTYKLFNDCINGSCIRRSVIDNDTGMSFVFHARKYAYDALGTKNKELIRSWRFSVIGERLYWEKIGNKRYRRKHSEVFDILG